MSKGWGEFIVAVVFKCLRIRLPMSFAFADTGHFQTISPNQLSDRARQSIKPVADEALALDLDYAFSYWLQTVGTIEGAAAAFLAKDGRTFLLIVYVKNWTNVNVDEKLVYAFVSRLSNGNAIVTAGSKGDLDAPEHILGEAHPGKPMTEVFDRHLTRIGEANAQVIEAHSAEQLEPMLREYEEENFAFNIERGVYAPVSDGEVARLQRLSLSTSELPKAQPKKQLQGLEMICWIAMVAGLTLSLRDDPVNAGQMLFRLGMLIIPLGGIATIWLVRAVSRMQHQSNDPRSD